MTSLRSLKLDLYDFPNAFGEDGILTKIASNFKIANVLSKDELAALPDCDFALIIKTGSERLRKYPVPDKQHAIVSSLFFQDTKKLLPPIAIKTAEENLHRALKSEEIVSNEVSVSELALSNQMAKIASVRDERAGLSNEDFALVIKEGASIRRLYPIHTEGLCKTANQYFTYNYKRMPLEARHSFAKALVKKVREGKFSVKLSHEVHKYYSPRYNRNLEFELNARKDVAKDADVRLALDKLAMAAKKTTPEKLANWLMKLDKIAGFDRYFGSRFSDSYQAVFAKGTTDKTAQMGGDYRQGGTGQPAGSGVSLVGKYQFDPTSLQTVPYEGPLMDLMSREDYLDVQKDPKAFAALPDPYKKAISDYVKGLEAKS